jgi:hypothetical protein
MIVDPDLDEAYFIGNEEDNVAQETVKANGRFVS